MHGHLKATQRYPEAASKEPPVSRAGAVGLSPAARSQATLGNAKIQRALRFGGIQAKLSIGRSDDPYEVEADRVAQLVVSQASEPSARRTCSVCNGAGTCPQCMQKSLGIQRKVAAENPSEVSPETESQLDSLRGDGRPLPEAVRDRFEPHFGQDLHGVRIHTGARAAQLATSLGARALTSGRDIVFGSGEFAPEHAPGQRLLAHELTHVIQQGGATARSEDSRPSVLRLQTLTGTPGGPDPCLDLLQQIIELLNEVAKRINDALDDRHDLYEDPDPEHGSWEGHSDRFKYDRGRLRQKLAEWDANDKCRGFQFSEQQQEDMKEAREFSEKEFPAKPSPAMRSSESGESVWDTVRKYLPAVVVGALIAAGAIYAGILIAACFASGACEFAAILAAAGFVLFVAISAALRAAGVRDEPSSGSVASVDRPPADSGDEDGQGGGSDNQEG